ncbi:MAG: FtsX-like permease family protein, partial [Phycisphaerales bacterium]|nr:FtsX-like permease family protein [Phycisphaerales bacterium]
FYDFPFLAYTLKPHVLVLGFFVSATAATVGVIHALRSAMRLPPAEAMRPQAPPSFRPTILERLGLHRLVPSAVRMILRQLERQPIKTALSILGVAMATAVMVLGSFSEDAIHYLVEFQFNRVQQFDVDVILADQTDDTALSTFRNMPGVLVVEPYRSLAVRIRNGHIERQIGVIGLTERDGLYQLLDLRGSPVVLPEHGIVLSTILADLLGVGVGDSITVKVMQGRRPTFTTEVAGVMDDFSGLTAYMHLDTMNRLMQEEHTIGGAYMSVDSASIDALYRELHETPRVVAVNVKAATETNFRETIARQMELMRPFLIGFSVVIAFGVVYNSARISLSERSRDLATLRVLGMTRREISLIQLGELAIVTGLAIPIGLILGYLLAWWTSIATATELMRIPFIIDPATFALAALVVAGASVVSGYVVLQRLRELDLVSVLKARE